MIALGESLGALHNCADADAAGAVAVGALHAAIDCDWAGVSLSPSCRPPTESDRAERLLWSTDGFDLSGLLDDAEHHADDDPLHTARLRRTLEGPASVGQFVGDGALGCSAFYTRALAPRSTRRLLGDLTPGTTNSGMLCGRSRGGDFDADDRAAMRLVSRHFNAWLDAHARRSGGRVIASGRAHALERIVWLVFDAEGRVMRSDPFGSAALERMAPGAAARGMLPGAWMDRLRRRASGAPPEPIRDASGRTRVYPAPIRPAPGEHSAFFVIGPDAPRDPWGRAGLTAREGEVLGWIAGGKSNREIAQTLEISPLTVKTHVERVLRKIGCANRAAASAWAVEAMSRDAD